MRKTALALIAAAALAAGAAQAQSATYAIDPTHTFVTFEISHFGTSTSPTAHREAETAKAHRG